MKKSIIALAVAGALTAPLAQADATLYGVAQFRLIDQDEKSLNAQMAKTRLGVKGTVDNDIEGLTTGFQFEWEFSGANGDDAGISEVRKSLVYMKGDFGQVTFGRQNNPAAAFKKADIMGRHSAQFALVGDRISNAITYASPDLSGLQLHAGFTADGANEDAAAATATTIPATGAPTLGTDATTGSEDADAYILGATYGIAGFDLALTHVASNNKADNTDTDTTSFGVGYTMGDLYLAASYSEMDSDVADSDADVTQLAASYGIGKTTVYAQYEVLDQDGADEKLKKTGLGVSYALGSSASVALETFQFNDEAEETVATSTGATSVVADATVLQYTLSF
ncbi:porin [Aliamphritea hakodatensis]|uniref:porin n=1 Tax=Aliamphritea hakodatensis TaxID=2895352 RepID=UPI0022FD656B|nr:porin [Aliamphritea hakodatensis]